MHLDQVWCYYNNSQLANAFIKSHAKKSSKFEMKKIMKNGHIQASSTDRGNFQTEKEKFDFKLMK